ncbi:transposase [Escherichia coli]|nr:transposase [Escherichia coli]
MPGIGIAASNIMFSMGAAMSLGGVAQMLAPKAKTQEYRATETLTQRELIARLKQHIPEKFFKMVRYFGFIDRNLNPKKIKKTPQNGCLFNTACVP